MNTKDNSEQANLNFLNLGLQFITRSGAVKIFLYLTLLIALTCFVFSFKIPPLLAFFVFVVFIVWLFKYLFALLPERPELFQDSKTWLGHQRLLVGNKQKGLYQLPSQTQLVQPIIQRKAVSVKANIVPVKQK